MGNLVLATREQNLQFRNWFYEVQIANADDLSLRDYLKKNKASADECREWGEECLSKFGLKTQIRNNGRGNLKY